MKLNFFRSLLALMILTSLVCVMGCGSDTPIEPEKPGQEPSNPNETAPNTPDLPQESLPVPGLSFTTVTLSNEGDTFACVIHGLTDYTWNAESDQTWCTVSTNNNILKVSVTPNHDNVKRTAYISILHSDGREMGKLQIDQCPIIDNERIEFSTSSKHSFYPMFTATWCPFSPDMDRSLEEIQKRWDNPIVPMRIHVKESALYSPLSIELSERYDNSTTPVGYFENYFEVYNIHEGNISVDYFWNLILSRTCDGNGYTKRCSSIGCNASMSDISIKAEITIRPVVTGEYRIIAYILEDNILTSQMSAEGEIPNYCHNDVLIGALTSLKGQEMELTTTSKTLTLEGDIPENANLSNLRLLIVLERNIAHLNYSDGCWYADNCLSIPLGKSSGNGTIENIYIGDEINN